MTDFPWFDAIVHCCVHLNAFTKVFEIGLNLLTCWKYKTFMTKLFLSHPTNCTYEHWLNFSSLIKVRLYYWPSTQKKFKRKKFKSYYFWNIKIQALKRQQWDKWVALKQWFISDFIYPPTFLIPSSCKNVKESQNRWPSLFS